MGAAEPVFTRWLPSGQHFYPSVPFKLPKVREEGRTQSRERRWEGWSQGSVRPGFHMEQLSSACTSSQGIALSMDYAGRSNLCAHELVYLGQDQLKPKYKGQGHSGKPLNPETPLLRRKDKMGRLFLKNERRKEHPKHTFGWQQAKPPLVNSVHNCRRIHCSQPTQHPQL